MDMATVCHNMGWCYIKLSQFDAAEETLSRAQSVLTAMGSEDERISSSVERALHEVWQLKFGRW
jgi:Tfp pilus assembly protein PilF